MRPATCGARRRSRPATERASRSIDCSRSSARCATAAPTNTVGRQATRSSRRGSWPSGSGSWPTSAADAASAATTMRDGAWRQSSSAWPSAPTRCRSGCRSLRSGGDRAERDRLRPPHGSSKTAAPPSTCARLRRATAEGKRGRTGRDRSRPGALAGTARRRGRRTRRARTIPRESSWPTIVAHPGAARASRRAAASDAELGRQGSAGDQPAQTDDGRQSAQQSGQRSRAAASPGNQEASHRVAEAMANRVPGGHRARGAGDRRVASCAREIGALRQRYAGNCDAPVG